MSHMQRLAVSPGLSRVFAFNIESGLGVLLNVETLQLDELFKAKFAQRDSFA